MGFSNNSGRHGSTNGVGILSGSEADVATFEIVLGCFLIRFASQGIDL
jgi:hypothetical protein